MQPCAGGHPSQSAHSLSVSSIGSEAMQLSKEEARELAEARFQYPQSDRRRCNLPPLSARPEEATVAFSILNRIGGDATIPDHSAPCYQCDFQYPQSDRRRCNFWAHPCGGGTYPTFQYPQSDRRRCNQSCQLLMQLCPELSVSSIGSEAMQHHSISPCPFISRLSVSSIGSEAMQLE